MSVPEKALAENGIFVVKMPSLQKKNKKYAKDTSPFILITKISR